MAVTDLFNDIGNFFGSATNTPAKGASDPWGTLLSTLGSVYGHQQANQAVNRNNVPTAAETQQNAIYQALMDPNSPMMQQATQQARAQNLSDFQQQLTEMQLADRRAGAMGQRPTFFAPERADETMNYLATRGLPALNAASTARARTNLQTAAQGFGTLQGAQAGRLSTSAQQGVSNSQFGSQVPMQILNILRGTPQQSTIQPQQQMPIYGPMQQYPGQQPINSMTYKQ